MWLNGNRRQEGKVVGSQNGIFNLNQEKSLKKTKRRIVHTRRRKPRAGTGREGSVEKQRSDWSCVDVLLALGGGKGHPDAMSTCLNTIQWRERK